MSTVTSDLGPTETPVRGFALFHKVITYVLAYLGLFGLALGGELDVPSVILLVVGFAATWPAEGARLESARWQLRWTIALALALLVQVARAAVGEPILAMALEWSGVLQLARLANRRAAREHLQIALLAFLHLCAATVLSTEITYGLAFLGFVIVAPWMLALTHLRAEIESQHEVRTRETAEPQTPDDERITLPPGATAGVTRMQLARVLSSRRLVGGPFLAGTALLSLPLFVLTALLFVLFPRIGLGMLAFGTGQGNTVAGFGDTVELGQVGRIRDDPTVVMRVTPPNLARDRAPTYLDLHLRGSSFDHYDGARWSRTHGERGRQLPQLLDEYTITRSFQSRADLPYQIVLDPLDQTVMFLPERTVALEIPPHVENGLELPRQISMYPGLDVRYEDHPGLGIRYTAWVAPDHRGEVVPALTGDDLSRYLQVPEDHERLAGLARAWAAAARTDRERAEAILARLHASPFRYSLDMRDPEGRPPLERFLLEWHAGHCEYYASAMVVLLRQLGVPARNVTGFLGGRWNPYGGYYSVRSGDAHAWVEAYLPGEGWVTFDPTPPARSQLGLAASVLDELRNLVDAAVVWWELDVVSFDLRSQRDILRDAFRFFRRARAGRSPDEETATERRESSGARWWLLAPLLLALAGGAWWLTRRRRASVDPLPARVARVIALYRALEAALAARGVPRPAQRTPREHAALLEASAFPEAELVSTVTRRYNEARFGTTSLQDTEITALEARIHALGRA